MTNQAAIARYRKSGYREFGRHAAYYEDGGDALRFEKRLGRAARVTPRDTEMQSDRRTQLSTAPLTPVGESVLMAAVRKRGHRPAFRVITCPGGSRLDFRLRPRRVMLMTIRRPSEMIRDGGCAETYAVAGTACMTARVAARRGAVIRKGHQ